MKLTIIRTYIRNSCFLGLKSFGRSGLLALMTVVLAGISGGCSDHPKDLIPEKKLVSVMSDMRIAEAMFDTGQGSLTGFTSKDEAQLAVLRKHGLTPTEYRKTIQWYGENLDKFDKVNRDVNKNLEKRLAKIDPKAKEHLEDENNIWPYSDHLIFRPGMLTEGITFSIPASEFERGTAAELKMKTSDPETTMAVLIGVDYTDGSMSYMDRTVSGFDQIRIHLQSDTARQVKRLFGVMRPKNRLDRTITFDSVRLVRLPFDSLEYYRISSQTEIDRPRKRQPKPIRLEADSVSDNSSDSIPGRMNRSRNVRNTPGRISRG